MTVHDAIPIRDGNDVATYYPYSKSFDTVVSP